MPRRNQNEEAETANAEQAEAAPVGRRARKQAKLERRTAAAEEASGEEGTAGGGKQKRGAGRAGARKGGGRREKKATRRGTTAGSATPDARGQQRIESRLARVEEAVAAQSKRSEELLQKVDEMLKGVSSSQDASKSKTSSSSRSSASKKPSGGG